MGKSSRDGDEGGKEHKKVKLSMDDEEGGEDHKKEKLSRDDEDGGEKHNKAKLSRDEGDGGEEHTKAKLLKDDEEGGEGHKKEKLLRDDEDGGEKHKKAMLSRDDKEGGEKHKKAKLAPEHDLPGDNESLPKVDDWSYSKIHYYAKAVIDEEFRAGMRAVFDSVWDKGESLMRRAILVRGVPLHSSKQALLDHFTTYGPIDKCILPINAAGECMSLALLIFKTQAGALAAVDKPTKFINGSLTHSQFVVAGGCYPPPRSHPAGTEVYVSNLLPNHPPLNILREEFLKFGEIDFGPARYAMPPGFVYIIYTTPEGANAATQQPGRTVGGCPLLCSTTMDEVLKATRENVKGILDKYRTQALAAFPTPHPANTTVYISHVNYDCDPYKLKDLFTKFGEIIAGPTNIDAERSVCLVIYKTEEGAKMALQEPWKLIDGHKIHCSGDTLAIEQAAEKSVRFTIEGSIGLVEIRQHQCDISIAQRKAKALENRNSCPDM